MSLIEHYDRLILQRPKVTLLVTLLILGLFSAYIPDFRLDASSESLVLENDQSLEYYRSIQERYTSDDYLIITYSPTQELFSDAVLADIASLRDALQQVKGVDSVTSLLDVPLINSPPLNFNTLQGGDHTLLSATTDRALARSELMSSPLYSNLLVSKDGRTTALQVNLVRDAVYFDLLEERKLLKQRRAEGVLTLEQQQALASVSRRYKERNAWLQQQHDGVIEAVRVIIDQHRQGAGLHLGGVPMIVSDSIAFVAKDLATFGVAVPIFLGLLLAFTFQALRWVVLPMLTCAGAIVIMMGFLGMVDWPVTVVSSNFVSLLLIITLSLMVHLIVRYRELIRLQPELDHHALVLETVRKKTIPSLYTSITTIVAFGSLIVSEIRPVIDFGYMMCIGIAVATLLAFTFFPAALVLMSPTKPRAEGYDLTGIITNALRHLIERHGGWVLFASLGLALLCAVGISRLSVENSFISYFKESTEIHQGMKLIDRALGGTTTLDIIIDAPKEAAVAAPVVHAASATAEDDEFADMFGDMDSEQGGGIALSSYWFNELKLTDAEQIHNYLDGLDESGKVLSISTAIRMFESLNEGESIDNLFLSLLHKKLPDEIKEALISPYMDEEGNQLRFNIRVYESDLSLKRDELLTKIRTDLTTHYGLRDEQVHLTGMVVLFNNMLQSLFRSQILTIGAVFVAILAMFYLLFRNFKVAVITLIPNVMAAAMVLGVMGLTNTPLDMMTITIAAICIGIAVDDAIHYVHRFMAEYRSCGDYWQAVRLCHDSIGRAMYYTTIIVTLGFSILATSNFIPTIYFGLLTGFSMVVALLANLTLLPLLFVRFKPLGG